MRTSLVNIKRPFQGDNYTIWRAGAIGWMKKL
jgi:hypothetical protein